MAPSAWLLLASCQLACGFIYELNYNLVGSQSAMSLTEGPMFTPSTAPFGSEPSTVTASFFLPPVGGADLNTAVNVYLAFTDEGTAALLGQTSLGTSGAPLGTSFCCTEAMFARGACPESTRAGQLIVGTSGAGATPMVQAFTVPLNTGARGSANFTVPTAGPVWLTTVVCGSTGAPLPAGAPVEVSAVFRNPYGYLPGTLVGLLPWYGVLLGCYLLLLVGYAVLMCLNASYVLPLQYVVLGVIVTGALEMVVSLATFNGKNLTGIPTPCNICPVTSDYMAAVVLNVLKRAVSRVLLLAVAMGFGVIHPTLPLRVSAMLGAMGVLYAAAGILAAVKAETSYDDTPTSWELPVFALDLLFLAFIQAHHTRTTASLKESNQTEKLRMYSSLVKVVIANVVAHIFLTVVVLGIRGGHVALDWRLVFVLNHFWDALYFLVLLAGAYIWAPGPTAYRYAWYAQPEQEGGGGGGAGGGNLGDGEEEEEEGEEEGGGGGMWRAARAWGRGRWRWSWGPCRARPWRAQRAAAARAALLLRRLLGRRQGRLRRTRLAPLSLAQRRMRRRRRRSARSAWRGGWRAQQQGLQRAQLAAAAAAAGGAAAAARAAPYQSPQQRPPWLGMAAQTCWRRATRSAWPRLARGPRARQPRPCLAQPYE